MVSGRLMTVLAWLERFPEGYVRGSAPLSIIKAWVSGLLGYERDARQSIEYALRTGFEGALPDGSSTVDTCGRTAAVDVPVG